MKRKLLIIFSVIILVLAMTTNLVACKHTHNWKDEWQTDATHHWHECEKKGCKEKGDYDNHSFKIQNDEDYHWNLCSVCGYATSKVAHTFDDNLVCTGCGAKHIIKYLTIMKLTGMIVILIAELTETKSLIHL